MSNKRNAFIIGLASFTFFTGCIAFTAITDQNKTIAKNQQAAQIPVTTPNTRVATDYLPTGQTDSLPPVTSSPLPVNVPIAASQTPKPQDAATITPTTPQQSPQPAASSLAPAVPAQPATPAPAAKPTSKTTKTRAS